MSPPWLLRLRVPLVCAAVGLLSVAMGPDDNWDLLYYHLYAPYAYLHGRYLYDIGPAQFQGFLNPTADLLFYALTSSILNDAPRLIAFIMGAVHGVNAALVLAIARQVLRPIARFERASLCAAALLMGVSGAGFVSLVGTTTNDLVNSIFVLGALLGVLRAADGGGERAWRGFAWSGLLAGAGIGLKYTVAVFFPGLALIALVAAIRQKSIACPIAFAVAAVLGFAAVAGHHLVTLWQLFGNPVFPFLNQVFGSPYYEIESIRDTRFVPRDIWQLIAYPFYWATTNRYVVSELPFRDLRGAIAYVALAAGLLALAWNRLGSLRRLPACAETRGLGLVFLFVAVSFLCWELGFGIYRYAVALEMLTGVVTMGALIWLVADRRLRVAAAFALLTLAATTTVYLGWGRGEFDEKYVDVRVPPLPVNSIVLIATWDPVAYFIPFAEPTARFLGIENNYLQISQTNRLASEVKRLMRTPGPAKFVLGIGPIDVGKMNSLLERLGLRLRASPCLTVESNLADAEDEILSLCPVTES